MVHQQANCHGGSGADTELVHTYVSCLLLFTVVPNCRSSRLSSQAPQTSQRWRCGKRCVLMTQRSTSQHSSQLTTNPISSRSCNCVLCAPAAAVARNSLPIFQVLTTEMSFVLLMFDLSFPHSRVVLACTHMPNPLTNMTRLHTRRRTCTRARSTWRLPLSSGRCASCTTSHTACLSGSSSLCTSPLSTTSGQQVWLCVCVCVRGGGCCVLLGVWLLMLLFVHMELTVRLSCTASG